MVNSEVTLKVLSSIKRDIIDLQETREDKMIEFLKIKKEIMTLNQNIGNKQRDLLSKIP